MAWRWPRRRRRRFFWNCLLNNSIAGKAVDGTALHTVVAHVVVVFVVGASRKIFQTCLQTEKTKTKGAEDVGSDGASMFRQKTSFRVLFFTLKLVKSIGHKQLRLLWHYMEPSRTECWE